MVGPILHGSVLPTQRKSSLLQDVPLSLIAGIISSYGIVLALQSLRISLMVGSLLALLGLGCFGISLLKQPNNAVETRSSSIIKWLGVSVVCLLYLAPLLTQPLTDWDARSIWFFHAKMIYSAGSFSQSTGWQHPSVEFSHPDYPNLVPVLAAQAAYVKGFWNEYLPKVSLFFLLVPAVIWLFTFARLSISAAVLLLLLPFSLREYLWNGYMDGYLALYFSVALLLLGRYSVNRQTIDLVSSLSCLSLLLYIKNEGVVAALAGLIARGGVALLKPGHQLGSLRRILADHRQIGLLGIGQVLPFILWSFYKQQWGLSNDLQIGTGQSLALITSRLTSGALTLILQRAGEQIASAVLLVGFLSAILIAQKIARPPGVVWVWLAIGLYFIGLTVVYLLTPFELAWHLETSLSRTMLSISSGLYGVSFFLLDSLERHHQQTSLQNRQPVIAET